LYPELAFLHTVSSPANERLYLVSDWWHHIVECIHYLEKITQLCRAWKITAVQYTQRLQILGTNAVILYEVIGQPLESSRVSWCTGNPHAIDTTWPEIPLGTPQCPYSHAFHDNIETWRELAVSIMLASESDRMLNYGSMSLQSGYSWLNMTYWWIITERTGNGSWLSHEIFAELWTATSKSKIDSICQHWHALAQLHCIFHTQYLVSTYFMSQVSVLSSLLCRICCCCWTSFLGWLWHGFTVAC
jgi:hypothetical protein